MNALQILVLSALLSLLVSKGVRAESPTQYFCTVDAATGFYFENGEWGTANFSDRRKFLLKEIDAAWQGSNWTVGDKIWELVEIGKKYPIAYCADWYSSVEGNRERGKKINCEGLYKLDFDKETLRFLLSYFVGYTNGEDNNKNTPSLSIGKCSPL